MKRQILKSFRKFLSLQQNALLWTFIPAVLWIGATYARPWVIETRCSQNPSYCIKESILDIDQLSVGKEDGKADEYSYLTQNFSGLWGIVLPMTWNITQYVQGNLAAPTALVFTGVDFLALVQVACWNGLLTELSHLISQRPRPFVYLDPAGRGIDSAHYTSFYSGHTSFSAASTIAGFLILFYRNAPSFFIFLSLISSQALVFSTAYFRIMAGRHFLTDVISGAIAGALVAWFVLSRRFKLKLFSKKVL